MGRQEESVRYVSPVTARLFAKAGSARAYLGLGDGRALVAATTGRRGMKRPASFAGRLSTSVTDIPHEAAMELTKIGGPVGLHRVHVVRQEVYDHSGMPLKSPQDRLQEILRERGYDPGPCSAQEAGCLCQPTDKQVGDYGHDLVHAVRRRDQAALEALVKQGKTMGACNRFGESAVHLATRRGNVAILSYLLAHGGSLHCADDYGKTPLHDACWTGQPRFDVVKLMLDFDWTLLRAADVRGATPLRYAKRQHWALWCRFLDEVKDVYWPMMPARVRGEPLAQLAPGEPAQQAPGEPAPCTEPVSQAALPAARQQAPPGRKEGGK